MAMDATKGSAGWPAVTAETHPWEPAINEGVSHRARLRARGPYPSSVPPFIANLVIPVLDKSTTVDAEDAIAGLARFDGEYGSIGAPFAAILLRSESASSSEIEQLTANPKSIALAELGGKSGPNARLIVANTRAMEAAIALSDDLDGDAIITMQFALLGESYPEYTGRWRTQEVWIGGGNTNSPHGAAFVPPHHSRVPSLMEDLMIFANRLDLPALPQIAIAHAQFETIHPFPDGNGRTGRALIHSMLRRLGITRNVTVPVSAGLLQNTRGYFDALTAYRQGDVAPIVNAFSQAIASALFNGRALLQELGEFRTNAEQTTTARRGSAGWRAIEQLVRLPVVNATSLAAALQVTPQNAQAGIDRLVADGILRQSGESKRNRFYEAEAVLVALEGFAQRTRRTRLSGRNS